jgi:hypothetical protein
VRNSATDPKWRCKGFTAPSLTIYRSGAAALPRTTRATCINCKRYRLPLTDGSQCAETAGCARTHNHYGAATKGPRCPVTSAPPPRRPLRSWLHCLKRRARCTLPLPRLRSLNGPVLCKGSPPPPRGPSQGLEQIRPSKGATTDQWPYVLLVEGGHHRCPQSQRITDLQLEGWLGHDPTNPADVTKTGVLSHHPVMALLIRGSKPDPRRVRTGAPDQQS